MTAERFTPPFTRRDVLRTAEGTAAFFWLAVPLQMKVPTGPSPP